MWAIFIQKLAVELGMDAEKSGPMRSNTARIPCIYLYQVCTRICDDALYLFAQTLYLNFWIDNMHNFILQISNTCSKKRTIWSEQQELCFCFFRKMEKSVQQPISHLELCICCVVCIYWHLATSYILVIHMIWLEHHLYARWIHLLETYIRHPFFDEQWPRQTSASSVTYINVWNSGLDQLLPKEKRPWTEVRARRNRVQWQRTKPWVPPQRDWSAHASELRTSAAPHAASRRRQPDLRHPACARTAISRSALSQQASEDKAEPVAAR